MKDQERDIAGTGDTMLHQMGLTMGSWDASTPHRQNENALYRDVLLDFCGIPGGTGVFTETIHSGDIELVPLHKELLAQP